MASTSPSSADTGTDAPCVLPPRIRFATRRNRLSPSAGEDLVAIGARHHQRVDRHLPRLAMNGESGPFGEQVSKRERPCRRVTVRLQATGNLRIEFGQNVVRFVASPRRCALQLIGLELVGGGDQRLEGEVDHRELPCRLGVERDRAAVDVALEAGDLERGFEDRGRFLRIQRRRRGQQ